MIRKTKNISLILLENLGEKLYTSGWSSGESVAIRIDEDETRDATETEDVETDNNQSRETAVSDTENAAP